MAESPSAFTLSVATTLPMAACVVWLVDSIVLVSLSKLAHPALGLNLGREGKVGVDYMYQRLIVEVEEDGRCTPQPRVGVAGQRTR